MFKKEVTVYGCATVEHALEKAAENAKALLWREKDDCMTINQFKLVLLRVEKEFRLHGYGDDDDHVWVFELVVE